MSLERLAFVQQPKLQSPAIDCGDAFSIKPSRTHPGLHVRIDFATGYRMNPDPIGPDLCADGGIERAAAKHARSTGMVEEHDVIHREPSDRHNIDHYVTRSMAACRCSKIGPRAEA